MRMHGHGAHDDAKYASELVLEWAERDPLLRYRGVLESGGLDHAAVEEAVDAAIANAVETALAAPMPDPARVLDGVFATGEPEPLGIGPSRWSGYRGR